MNKKISKAAHWIITIAMIAVLIFFARSVNWTAAWHAIKAAYLPLVIAAILVNILTIVLKAVRWWIFLRPAGVNSLSLAIRAMLAGTGLNNLVVANGGDAARVMFVSRITKTSSSTILATLALERLFDPVGFVILIAYTVTAYKLPETLDRWRIVAQGALILTLILVIWFAYHSRGVTTTQVTERGDEPGTILSRLKSYFSAFFQSTRALATPARFGWATAISMISWITQLYTFIWCAQAIGIHMPVSGHLVALLAVNLVFIIRSTPGNLGVFQLAYILASAQFGISREDALAASFLIQTIQLIPVTLIGAAVVIAAQQFPASLSAGKQ